MDVSRREGDRYRSYDTPAEAFEAAGLGDKHNVELHRRLADAFNARDVEAFLALCDPEIEFHSSFAVVGGAVYRGHDGVRSWHRDLEDTWDEIRVEPEAFFDLGDRTLVYYVLRGRGRQSRVAVTLPTAQVAKWRNGLVVYLKAYVQRDDALRELGVSEDALTPIVP